MSTRVRYCPCHPTWFHGLPVHLFDDVPDLGLTPAGHPHQPEERRCAAAGE